jgi:hypothetical protein
MKMRDIMRIVESEPRRVPGAGMKRRAPRNDAALLALPLIRMEEVTDLNGQRRPAWDARWEETVADTLDFYGQDLGARHILDALKNPNGIAERGMDGTHFDEDGESRTVIYDLVIRINRDQWMRRVDFQWAVERLTQWVTFSGD